MLELISIVVSIVAYVLNSIGLFRAAKAKQINNPWLAWIPVANVWILALFPTEYKLKRLAEKFLLQRFLPA